MSALYYIYIPPAVDFRKGAFMHVRIFGTGKRFVHFVQNAHIRGKFRRKVAYAGRKRAKYRLNLLALVYGQRDKFVIEFEHVFGFYEKSCARLGTVVNETANLIFIFGFYGNYEAVVANSYDSVLQILRVLYEVFGQFGTDFFV